MKMLYYNSTTVLLIALLLGVVTQGCAESSIVDSDEDSAIEHVVAAKSGNAAVVFTKPFLAAIGEDWCTMWGSDGVNHYRDGLKAISTVRTRKGTEVATCLLHDLPNDTGEVLYFNRDNMPGGNDPSDPGTYMAWTFFGLTADWWGRVTPSGQGLLKMQVNPSSDEYLSFQEYCDGYPDGVLTADLMTYGFCE